MVVLGRLRTKAVIICLSCFSSKKLAVNESRVVMTRRTGAGEARWAFINYQRRTWGHEPALHTERSWWSQMGTK